MLENFAKSIGYDDPLKIYLSKIEELLLGDYFISKRSVALLLLQRDEEVFGIVAKKENERLADIKKIISEAEHHYSHPLTYIISLRRQKEASRLANSVMSIREGHKISLRDKKHT